MPHNERSMIAVIHAQGTGRTGHESRVLGDAVGEAASDARNVGAVTEAVLEGAVRGLMKLGSLVQLSHLHWIQVMK